MAGLDLTTEKVEKMTRRMLYAGMKKLACEVFWGRVWGRMFGQILQKQRTSLAVGHKML